MWCTEGITLFKPYQHSFLLSIIENTTVYLGKQHNVVNVIRLLNGQPIILDTKYYKITHVSTRKVITSLLCY